MSQLFTQGGFGCRKTTPDLRYQKRLVGTTARFSQVLEIAAQGVNMREAEE